MDHLFKKIFNKLLYQKGFCIANNMEKILGRRRKVSIVTDFVRQSSIELCAQEIYNKNILGSVAELGVYRGDFSSFINKLFPDRPFYLFDTFKGFSEIDILIDEKNNFSVNDQDFSNTSVEVVMNKMSNPKTCIIKKGYFPDSAININDKFAFVSIDADLYKPIYDGLTFFYPRLTRGGYIFIHDYNNKRYKGAKKSVLDFCEKFEITHFPLSDAGGSAIIMK